ncbi:MAG: phosphatidate cytidylyltransferase, partial [Clostridia bacterium]|nr:phosphatidate cytidylyltransferase [Clostridia bacterium]
KREFGVKDYGKIFPGHGGIMDRFDGIMVSGLFVYLFSGFVKLL